MRSIETGRFRLDSGTRVAVTTMVASSEAGAASVAAALSGTAAKARAPLMKRIRENSVLGLIDNMASHARHLESTRLHSLVVASNDCNRVCRGCQRAGVL